MPWHTRTDVPRRSSWLCPAAARELFQIAEECLPGSVDSAPLSEAPLWHRSYFLDEKFRMLKTLHIDFISDVTCPWCAIGFHSLEIALRALNGEVAADVQFHPFEINPDLPPDGEEVHANLARKYGNTREQTRRNGEAIRVRGESVGFTFNMAKRSHYYNTFDAHRLLHWAAIEGKQRALKDALVTAYFTQGEDISSHAVLERLAGDAGLDTTKAHEVLSTGRFVEEVRSQEEHWRTLGVHSVPTLVVDGKYAIQGGQSPDTYADLLRKIANEA